MKKPVDELCERCGGWVWHRLDPCNCKPNALATTMDNTFSGRLKKTRLSQNLSLEQVARRAGLSKTGYWQIENDQSEPMANTLVGLSNALGVSIDWLLTGKAK
jgi:DNA-binding XRE family transcriptional regulator